MFSLEHPGRPWLAPCPISYEKVFCIGYRGDVMNRGDKSYCETSQWLEEIMDAANFGLDPARTKLGSARVGSSWPGLGSTLLVSVWLLFAWLGPAWASLAVSELVRIG